MTTIEYTCDYCNHKWREDLSFFAKAQTCSKCKSGKKYIREKTLDEAKTNIYYQDEPLKDAYVDPSDWGNHD